MIHDEPRALMCDVAGTELTDEDKELLQHPLVGGLILFKRNCESPEQIHTLTSAIREVKPDILIAVDQEGGRVQRIQEGVTKLPPMKTFGDIYDKNTDKARRLVEMCGWLMATEVLSLGIDFSFAPVLDCDSGISQIIGDRAFHHDPAVVSDLASLFVYGMQEAGMQAIGKHFPGHGSVAPDSHVALPIDDRDFKTIKSYDLVPFKKLIEAGMAGLMPAHIIFPQIDELPVGFSSKWLQTILRQQLNFDGAIFSDDLTMEGAACVGSVPERAQKALDAGCDMILVCNNRQATYETIDALSNYQPDEHKLKRLQKMRGIKKLDYEILKDNPNWQHVHDIISSVR